MYTGEVLLRGKRDLGFEVVNGIQIPCRIPPFRNLPFTQFIPICSNSVAAAAPAAATTTDLVSPEMSTPSGFLVSVSILIPSAEPTYISVLTTSISLTTTILETATVEPESPVASKTYSMVSSTLQSSPTDSVQLNTVQSSNPATESTILAAASTPVVQTSSRAQSTTIGSPVPLTTAIASLATLITPAISLPLSSASTITPLSSPDNEVIASSHNLSTNDKVAIATATVLTVLAIFVGLLALYLRRKRKARAQRRKHFSILTSGGNGSSYGDHGSRVMMTGGVDHRGGLGPNGYPQDVKMANGQFLDKTAGGIEIQIPAATKYTPILIDGRGGIDIGAGRRALWGEMSPIPEDEDGAEAMDRMGRNGGPAIPAPAAFAFSRSISDSGSSSGSLSPASSGDGERFTPLTMARTQNDSTQNKSLGIWDRRHLTNKSSPSSNDDNNTKISGSRSEGKFGGLLIPRNTTEKKSGAESVLSLTHRFNQKAQQEITLSPESQELNWLTKEYEAERLRKEQAKVGEVKKCMLKDRHIQVQTPTLPALDSRKLGSHW